MARIERAFVALNGAILVLVLMGMALILGVDRFMSECRSITNFIGNAVATVVVSRWQGALDRETFDAVMGGREPASPAVPVTGLALHPAGLQLGERSAD